MGWFIYSSFLFFAHIHLVFSQLPSDQVTAMTRIYEIFHNRNNGSSFVWSKFAKESNPCSWTGVSCNSDNSSITRISFVSFSLSGSEFLPVLCQIHTLESLDVSNNHLTSIPDSFFTDCGKINGLRLLSFSKNGLYGPFPDFNGFIALEHLDLSHNSLSGAITSQFSELDSLKSLNLTSNNLTGDIPLNLGRNNLLEELLLSFNNFTSQIPSQITKYGNMRAIDLSANRLYGSIPEELGQLAKLETLVLSRNNLSGGIPIWLPNVTTLSRFAANQNGFNGTIPPGITSNITRLDLSYNKLTGIMPFDLLSGPNLQYLDLSYNELEGSIPENISRSMIRLRLGSNSLTGNLRADAFRNLVELTYLELDNNSLSGSLPPELGMCRKLALLNLEKNRFSGPLPRELGDAENLQGLNLRFNSFFGQIPEAITSLSRLQNLNLSGNSFNGSIPSRIGDLKSLEKLDLRDNGLSGPIPGSIRGLSSLIELQLGNNQLTGPIPNMPEKLQIALNLSHNLFDGPIPYTLSGLGQLEVLDLSSNRFSGAVPGFLTGMASLIRLVLSNNRLSGVLPKFRDFTTVEYNGNNLVPSENPTSETGKKKKSISRDVLIAVASASVTVTLLIFFALLMFRKYQRINDEEHLPSPEDDDSPPRVVRGHILTSHIIHRSNIDFDKAMETVIDLSNVALKTRFSTYYKALMPSGTNYFIKKLNWSNRIFQEKFADELKGLGKISNSNVMIPLAYVLTPDSAYLIYDFAAKGTLFEVLHGETGHVLDWANRYSIAIGLSQGLAFLHGFSSGPILLLDLSSKTVLLKSLNEPQIGDIELYKITDPSKSTGNISTVVGSVGYIPPEYAYTMRITSAGNVYSFGVILLELLTGKTSVFGDFKLVEWVLSKSMEQSNMDRILDSSVSEASPAVRSQMLAVLKVALACVSIAPGARPKMKSVLRMLLNAS